jgi:hypothetical protein
MHPTRGSCILMCTDTSLSALDEWIGEHTCHNEVEITSALLEAAFERQIALLGEKDAFDLMKSAFRNCEGFRMPAPHEPFHAHGGRRPKTSKGGNRGLGRLCSATNATPMGILPRVQARM